MTDELKMTFEFPVSSKGDHELLVTFSSPIKELDKAGFDSVSFVAQALQFLMSEHELDSNKLIVGKKWSFLIPFKRYGVLLPTNKKFLSDESPKDKPWDKHRSESDSISALYGDAGFERYQERIDKCSTVLGFKIAVLNEVKSYKLSSSHFCRHRHCAVCQWRKTMRWTARFLEALPKIQEDYPTHRYIFLTLTVKSCLASDLRANIDLINSAWKRLSERKKFPAIGFVKSIEVTRLFDCYYNGKFKGRHGKTWVKKWELKHKCKLTLQPTMEAHPHVHILLMVPSGYFGSRGGYLSQKQWVEMWQECLRIDYRPVVDVRAVKPKDDLNLVSTLKEVLKYSVKPEDMAEDTDWLTEITKQLHKTRSISLGGVIKNYLSEADANEPDDLININEDKEAEPVSDELLIFDWFRDIKRYGRRNV